ncbi:MAG: hypothetical protein A4E73_02454 [Syntrophaceae bacterium PtaU1.Bin231]|nr:MAG: hypothetical protein A4E73_02454 [Syntrophaceae bacterium PtaU1.Bin231]
MKVAIVAIVAALIVAAPSVTCRVVDVHPWNRIADPWQTEKAFWRFHYIKVRFPNFAAMQIPDNAEGALPWKVVWYDRAGRRVETWIRWKKGLSTKATNVCLISPQGGCAE